MVRTRIYYQDTDAGGVVYFANYLKLFEKSWFEHLLSLGISLPDWEKEGAFLMVKTVHLDLREKLRYGDEVEVRSSVTTVKNAQFLMRHGVLKEGRVVAEGETVMVCVDQSGKPRRLPAEFRRRLDAAP
ncbi:MAG: thioesterase family protein [Syntrophorhabdales bacterium]|jgi:acyl-CoA thioester hydrolase